MKKKKCCNNNDDKNIVLIKLIHTRVCDSVIAGQISRSLYVEEGKCFSFMCKSHVSHVNSQKGV